MRCRLSGLEDGVEFIEKSDNAAMLGFGEPALGAASPEIAGLLDLLNIDTAGCGIKLTKAEAKGAMHNGTEGACAGRTRENAVVDADGACGEVVHGGDMAASLAGVEFDDKTDLEKAANVEVEGVDGAGEEVGQFAHGAGAGGVEGVDDLLTDGGGQGAELLEITYGGCGGWIGSRHDD